MIWSAVRYNEGIPYTRLKIYIGYIPQYTTIFLVYSLTRRAYIPGISALFQEITLIIPGIFENIPGMISFGNISRMRLLKIYPKVTEIYQVYSVTRET